MFSNLLQCLAVLDSPDENFCVESLRILKSKVKVLWDMDAALSIAQQDDAIEEGNPEEMGDQVEDIENFIPRTNNTRSKEKGKALTTSTIVKKEQPRKSILKAAKDRKEQISKNVYFKIHANASNYNNDYKEPEKKFSEVNDAFKSG